jgi:hypothetical protein
MEVVRETNREAHARTVTRDGREAVFNLKTPKSETRMFTISSVTTNESENDENIKREFATERLKTLTKTKIERDHSRASTLLLFGVLCCT